MTTAATSPEITAGGTAPTVVVPVEGGGGFAVRRVFCVGRNYAAHAREMGRDPDREPPFFFTAPSLRFLRFRRRPVSTRPRAAYALPGVSVAPPLHSISLRIP